MTSISGGSVPSDPSVPVTHPSLMDRAKNLAKDSVEGLKELTAGSRIAEREETLDSLSERAAATLETGNASAAKTEIHEIDTEIKSSKNWEKGLKIGAWAMVAFSAILLGASIACFATGVGVPLGLAFAALAIAAGAESVALFALADAEKSYQDKLHLMKQPLTQNSENAALRAENLQLKNQLAALGKLPSAAATHSTDAALTAVMSKPSSPLSSSGSTDSIAEIQLELEDDPPVGLEDDWLDYSSEVGSAETSSEIEDREDSESDSDSSIGEDSKTNLDAFLAKDKVGEEQRVEEEQIPVSTPRSSPTRSSSSGSMDISDLEVIQAERPVVTPETPSLSGSESVKSGRSTEASSPKKIPSPEPGKRHEGRKLGEIKQRRDSGVEPFSDFTKRIQGERSEQERNSSTTLPKTPKPPS